MEDILAEIAKYEAHRNLVVPIPITSLIMQSGK